MNSLVETSVLFTAALLRLEPTGEGVGQAEVGDSFAGPQQAPAGEARPKKETHLSSLYLSIYLSLCMPKRLVFAASQPLSAVRCSLRAFGGQSSGLGPLAESTVLSARRLRCRRTLALLKSLT